MTLMDMIRKWNNRKKESSSKFKQMQEDYRLQKMVLEREKSANRRELEKHFHEQEEKRIDESLKKIREQKNKELWRGNILSNNTSILHQDKQPKSNSILKQKNMFMGEGSLFFR